MDANQVGYVHELTWGERQDGAGQCVSTSSRVGRCRFSSQAASRRCRRTSWMQSAMRARLDTTVFRPRRMVLSSRRVSSSPASKRWKRACVTPICEFDGIGNAANDHRAVGNLFDVKLKAIDNLHRAPAAKIVPVVTIINGINNEQVGRIISSRSTIRKRIGFLSFQPVSFTGRDEAISGRSATGAALHAGASGPRREESDRASAFRRGTGIRFHSCPRLGDWADVMHAQDSNNDWGQLSRGRHPKLRDWDGLDD